MPVYSSAFDDQFENRGMAGLEYSDPAWTVSLHNRPYLKAHKPLPKRRDYLDSLAYMTALPLESELQAKNPKRLPDVQDDLSNQPPQLPSPTLPLTPPSGSEDATRKHTLEDTNDSPVEVQQPSRAGVTTPKAQKSPPTPDTTPPRVNTALQSRPFLETQYSLSSRTESFKTAREDFSSDDDASGHDWSSRHMPFQWSTPHMSSTSIDLVPSTDLSETPKKSNLRHQLSSDSTILARRTDSQLSTIAAERVFSPENTVITQLTRRSLIDQGPPELSHVSSPTDSNPSQNSPSKSSTGSPRVLKGSIRRTRHFSGPDPRSGAEEFVKAIGKVPSDDNVEGLTKRVNSWRNSGISATSTVEAIVVETSTPKHQTLRHSRKNPSLRSASSPIPTSNRSSWNSATQNEPHRLVRKRATLTNGNRLSMNSDVSKEPSVEPSAPSSAVKQEVETIKVVVIPQRRSSLQSSVPSTRRQSLSYSQGSGPRRSEDSGSNSRQPRRRRAMSDSFHQPVRLELRGRDRHYPPTVPPRSSSLSAPTSRNGSRASSMTSETLRLRRLAAEEDVHRTLARMETERSSLLPSLSQTESKGSERSTVLPSLSQKESKESDRGTQSMEITRDLSHLRPPSVPYTPLSQHSIITSSTTGPVEIHEATAVNYYPHNNDSLQLIEGKPVSESKAVREVGLNIDIPFTPPQPSNNIPDIVMESPLKNPRDPPQPPAFKITPPTPATQTPNEELDRQLGRPSMGRRNGLARRLGSMKRAFVHRPQSNEQLRSPFARSLTTTRARNRKQTQDLDNKLHPFWRPRSFWDDYIDSETESETDEDDDMEVNNSLGIPPAHVIFDGPLSLVRRISERRVAHKQRIIKRASVNSLRAANARSNNLIHMMSILRMKLQFLKLRDVHDRMLRARQRREERKRERRRAELRSSIGRTVVPRGDSRFPDSPPLGRYGPPSSWPRSGAP